jgi:hypothetical protein
MVKGERRGVSLESRGQQGTRAPVIFAVKT